MNEVTSLRKQLTFIAVLGLLLLTACNEDGTIADPHANTNDSAAREDMNHSSSTGELPQNLKTANNPTFPTGSEAIIQTNHMESMDQAEAVISGAYHTTAYSVSYKPTTESETIWNHKWVVHEELEDAGEKPLEPGSKVILNADHMKGMKGAEATIETAKNTTVYMVDFIPTNGDDEVMNHKWVIEDELTAP